ncbi:MAG: AMP-binding protein [Clostridia bacterium]|nr:AMP-binding protein [Clostridia bacterium]
MEQGNKITKLAHLKSYREVFLAEDMRQLINHTAEVNAELIAFKIKLKRATKTEPAVYREVYYPEFRDDIKAYGLGLMRMGLKGKRFAVIGKNSYTWMVGYLAPQFGLGIIIPLDRGLPYEELEASLIKSKADVLLFDKDLTDFAEKMRSEAKTNVSVWISMSEAESFEDMQKIMADGYAAPEEEKKAFDELPIDKDALSVLLFTSGTSGLAKAVMLSQYNITYNVYAMLLSEDLRRGDCYMAFLPYHHSFSATGQMLAICIGMSTCYCDGLKYVQQNLTEYKVTVFVGVPLLVESIYKKVLAGVKKQGKEKTFQKGLKISSLLRKIGIDKRRKLFKDILDQLGGTRIIISGASPLNPTVAKGLDDIGIDILQGYGLTETAPVVTAETTDFKRPGSIGGIMPGVEAEIWDCNEEGIGELVTKSPCVMLGYYEDPEATAEIMTDGWLHTGDLVSTDKDGFIYVRGRAKNVIVFKNGKNIYPEEVEELIKELPYALENMVYGAPNNGDYSDPILAAKIVYSRSWFEENGIASDEEMNKRVKADLDSISQQLPDYKRIQRFELTEEPMEKTTTGKVKRYKQIIN